MNTATSKVSAFRDKENPRGKKLKAKLVDHEGFATDMSIETSRMTYRGIDNTDQPMYACLNALRHGHSLAPSRGKK